MTSKECFDQIICNVNCKYGAPLGRGDKGIKPENVKIFDRKVNISQGYDKGGVYWGFPNNLRVQYTDDFSYIHFYRSYEAIK